MIPWGNVSQYSLSYLSPLSSCSSLPSFSGWNGSLLTNYIFIFMFCCRRDLHTLTFGIGIIVNYLCNVLLKKYIAEPRPRTRYTLGMSIWVHSLPRNPHLSLLPGGRKQLSVKSKRKIGNFLEEIGILANFSLQ